MEIILILILKILFEQSDTLDSSGTPTGAASGEIFQNDAFLLHSIVHILALITRDIFVSRRSNFKKSDRGKNRKFYIKFQRRMGVLLEIAWRKLNSNNSFSCAVISAWYQAKLESKKRFKRISNSEWKSCKYVRNKW